MVFTAEVIGLEFVASFLGYPLGMSCEKATESLGRRLWRVCAVCA